MKKVKTHAPTSEQIEKITLSPADQKTFAEALITPPKSNDALKKAYSRSRKLLKVKV